MIRYVHFEDRDLIDLLRKDDNSAFTELYNRYWKKLFYVAAAQLKNLSEAEELVQDIFMDIWNRRHDLNITNSVSGYLSVAVSYRALNILSKRQRHIRYIGSVDKNRTDNSTEQQLDFAELRNKLELLVGELPEKCKLVFKLSRYELLSRREIAAVLNITEKTVESHLTRALKNLRARFGLFLLVMMIILSFAVEFHLPLLKG